MNCPGNPRHCADDVCRSSDECAWPAPDRGVRVLHQCEVRMSTDDMEGLERCTQPARFLTKDEPMMWKGEEMVLHREMWLCDEHAPMFGPTQPTAALADIAPRKDKQ